MIALPETRSSAVEVLAAMRAAREDDARWREGKTWSLVFHAGHEVAELLEEAYALFLSENALNPMAFPSLKKFEAEVVAMTAALLGGDGTTVGNMTSGGTESILMAVKTARDWARAVRPEVKQPEMILPATAHPAFEKAAHYLGVRSVRTAVGPDFRADVAAVRAALTADTILVVGSAPSYPQGVVDPIAELAKLAEQQGLLCHVDACVGGFMLPFVRQLGYPVPLFDLGVSGVTSLSADLHKYGYAAKGASVILYRDSELRRHQFFVHTDWAGGIYASPTMTGTRPGGAIAAAWAVMNYLGQEGYREIAATVMDTCRRLKEGIEQIEGIHVLGDPPMSLLALASDELNVFEIGDVLTQRGWHLDRQQGPESLHLTVTYAHAPVADQFLRDLAEAVKEVRQFSLPKLANAVQVGVVQTAVRWLPDWLVSRLTRQASGLMGLGQGRLPQRSAAMYGMMASLPNQGDLDDIVLDLLDQLTKVEATERRR
ncbi:MAG: aspartate aminotransferase family protein [Candidatus Promineifilaceae bacterium]|nr:aspartate aminotransferase family protein [Candidatus Promineifilaceae bacterium]